MSNKFHSQVRTPDMGGNATNQEFTRAILASMEKAL
jgi:isocitrate dehydrogenase (NAD+)